GKRNALGDFKNIGARERAEALEAAVPRRRIRARVTARQAATVRERMFDAPDAPAFLVKHQVAHNATNGELRVFFNGIVLEIFVAAVAVDEMAPIRIALADATAESQPH